MIHKSTLTDIIKTNAIAFGLPGTLVAAIIVQESEGNQWAGRIEQTSKLWTRLFGRKREELAGWVPPVGTLPELWDEVCWRASSFGFMQILGETARVEGFSGQYLNELFEPSINIYYGCKYLRRCFVLADKLAKSGTMKPGRTIVEQALIYYNGSDKYPPLVLRHLTNGKVDALVNRNDLSETFNPIYT